MDCPKPGCENLDALEDIGFSYRDIRTGGGHHSFESWHSGCPDKADSLPRAMLCVCLQCQRTATLEISDQCRHHSIREVGSKEETTKTSRPLQCDCASPAPSKSRHKGQGQGEMSRTFHAEHCQYGAFILKCPFHVFGEPRVDVGAEIGACPARHWHCQGRLPGIEDDSCKYGIQTRQRISRSPACDQRAQKPVGIQCFSQVPGAKSSEAIARCTERMAGRIHSASALLKRAVHKTGILAAFLGLFSYNLFLGIHWFVFGWSLCLRCLIWMALRRRSGATCSRRARSKLRSCARHCIKASMFLFLIHNSIAFPFSGFLGDGHFRAACFSHCRDMRAPCWPECGNSIGTHGGIEIAWDTAHPIASAPPICRNSVGLSIPVVAACLGCLIILEGFLARDLLLLTFLPST